MKKGKHSIVGAVLLILIIVSLVIYIQVSGKEEAASTKLVQLSQEEQKELIDFQESLSEKGGFYDQVGVEMRKAGYHYVIGGMLYSKDDIRLYVIVPDNEKVTKQKQTDIKKILNNMMIKNEIDQNAFTIEVGHAEK